MADILFTVIDINADDDRFKTYEALDVDLKIKKMADRIEAIVNHARETHKEVMVIAAFREDGITGCAENLGLNQAQKKNLRMRCVS